MRAISAVAELLVDSWQLMVIQTLKHYEIAATQNYLWIPFFHVNANIIFVI